LLPGTTLKLSFRLPPACDADKAAQAVKSALEADVPPMSAVRFDLESTMAGWNAPEVAEWLEASMQRASQDFFDKPSMYMGTGGKISRGSVPGDRIAGAQVKCARA
jgi:hypothetical protein